jgi:Fe-S cluster biogenesis protein NfuA
MKTPVTVYSESTPNPNTMKFMTSLNLSSTAVEFNTPEEAVEAPLAARIFSFPFVTDVFISNNFITVTKANTVEWIDVTNELRGYIKNYLQAGYEVFKVQPTIKEEQSNSTNVAAHTAPTNDVEEKIIGLMEEYVKPAVESDGGAIFFDSYQDGVLKVELRGACSGCPSSTATLKDGIQSLFNRMMPEIKEVVAING